MIGNKKIELSKTSVASWRTTSGFICDQGLGLNIYLFQDN